MITEKDLQEAIAECQGQRNPNANTCIKLAAFLTIKNYLYPEQEEPGNYSPPVETSHGYSYNAEPATENTITFNSGSEFATSIDGRPQKEIWPILDEFIGTVQITDRPLYNALIRKLNE